MKTEHSQHFADFRLKEWCADLHSAKAKLVSRHPALAQFFVTLFVTGGDRQYQFPFLSIRAFKEHQVFNKDLHDLKRTFYSSGSTSSKHGIRAKSFLSSSGLGAYAQTAAAGVSEFLQRFSLDSSTPILCLVPRREAWPDSSLAEMFELLRVNGFAVEWFSPETVFSALAADMRDTVIFGTSFHHVLAAAQLGHAMNQCNKTMKKRRIVAVDTGGTKGRTQALSSEAMQRLLIETYKDYGEVSVASEYGMCELGSQAWSAAPGELRRFRCNSSLIPLSVDPKTFEASFVPRVWPGRKAFLAFIDWSNVDSYPAIITEDLGTLCAEPREFLLLGRAPLASAKGCSLRVETTPASIATQNSQSIQAQTQRNSLVRRPLHCRSFSEADFSRIKIGLLQKIAQAPKELFTFFELELLKDAVRSIARSSARTQNFGEAKHDTLLIVASANVPITFLFPVVAAFETGYTSVTLHLPSLREEDPISATVRTQIAWLLQALQQSFRDLGAPLKSMQQQSSEPVFEVCVSERELLAKEHSQEAHFDTVLVFGTDQTVAFLSDHFKGRCKTFVGLGEIENYLEVTGNLSPSTAPQIACACLAWKGRGCLTPRAVIFDETSLSLSETALETLIAEFRREYERIHRLEFEMAGDLLASYHWHDRIELQAKLLPWARFFAVGGSLIVDFTQCTDEFWQKDTTQLRAEIDFSKAGQGLVYLFRKSQVAALGLKPQFFNVNPGYHDLHMGKTWTEWLGAGPSNTV